ncbi:hypothetical protein Prudu_002199, partial [Prunus dulcis]
GNPTEFFEYIRGEHENNDSVIEVVGARVCYYKFNFVVGNNSKDKAYKGVLYYEKDGEITHVKFVKVDKEETARSAFKYSSRISDEGILRRGSMSLPYNEELVKGVWTVCYDHYDESLYNWVKRVVRDTGSSYTESSKLPIKNARNCLHPYWIETISQLINVVARVHGKGFFHGSLKKKENYVISEKCLKIINFGGSLEGKNQTYQDELKKDNFVDIKIMLGYLFCEHPKLHRRRKKQRILTLAKNGSRLIAMKNLSPNCLAIRFLKSPQERLEWIDTVNNDRKDPSTQWDVLTVLGKVDFVVFASWKGGGFKEAFMKEVFDYNPSSYKDDVVSLLRYLRNLNHHFRDVKKCKRPTVEEADHAIRRHFDNFLEALDKRKEGVEIDGLLVCGTSAGCNFQAR